MRYLFLLLFIFSCNKVSSPDEWSYSYLDLNTNYTGLSLYVNNDHVISVDMAIHWWHFNEGDFVRLEAYYCDSTNIIEFDKKTNIVVENGCN